MGTNLAVIDKELTARLPMFLQVLPPSVTPQRLMRTVIMSCEKTPKLLECTPQSIMNAATTAAVLGLECDGVTGQGYLVPYGNIAQFQVGYKGYNTLAARAGYTITGDVVREGDEFDYKKGTGAFVHHKPLMGARPGRKIVAGWALAECIGRPPIIEVMSIEDIEQVKARSQGAKKKDSPWNDLTGPGYPAMCGKTVKRRLARSMPLSVMQQAAALEDANEIGKAAYLQPGGDMKVVGSASVAPGPSGNGTISDRQPDNILTPANGDDGGGGYSDEPMTPAAIVFPNCKTPREFKVYSEPYLASATADEVRAWEANYREFIARLKESRHVDVQAMITSLMETYDNVLSLDQQAA